MGGPQVPVQVGSNTARNACQVIVSYLAEVFLPSTFDVQLAGGAGLSTQAPCMRWWPPLSRAPTTQQSTALQVGLFHHT